MKIEFDKSISILYHNKSAINIFENIVMHSKTKHSAMKYYFLRENVVSKEVKFKDVKIKEYIACIFTKNITKKTIEYIMQTLGVVSPTF